MRRAGSFLGSAWVRAAAVLLPAVLIAVLAVALGAPTASGQAPAERPNVVVVMTDDQDVRSMRAMPQVRELLVEHGTTFSHAFATTPLCCPSRATFMTGQYAHNHGVLTAYDARGGYYRLRGEETLPVWLGRAGYRTGHIGKFLNQYGTQDPQEVPPGWDEWYAALDPDAHMMYGYRLNENGSVVQYGETASDYQTDVYADKAVDFIDRNVAGGPFFLSVGTLAPHLELNDQNPRAAPRHEGVFADAPIGRTPAYDERDVSDKPRLIREKPRLRARRFFERLHRDRLETLLAVDELVGRLVTTLESSGELDNTVLIFTSDNGYLMGEHRLRGKSFPYEESARVPLIMSGPGVPEGVVRRQLVGNIDLAPTILEAAGATPGLTMDGRSLFPLAADQNVARSRPILLESWATVRYTAVRTRRYLHVRHRTGETELYDLARDPHQLRSRHGSRKYREVQRRLARRLAALGDCAGPTCR